MSRLRSIDDGDSTLIPTSQFQAWSSYTRAGINSNVKYV